jgi:hypothetical protein
MIVFVLKDTPHEFYRVRSQVVKSRILYRHQQGEPVAICVRTTPVNLRFSHCLNRPCYSIGLTQPQLQQSDQ